MALLSSSIVTTINDRRINNFVLCSYTYKMLVVLVCLLFVVNGVFVQPFNSVVDPESGTFVSRMKNSNACGELVSSVWDLSKNPVIEICDIGTKMNDVALQELRDFGHTWYLCAVLFELSNRLCTNDKNQEIPLNVTREAMKQPLNATNFCDNLKGTFHIEDYQEENKNVMDFFHSVSENQTKCHRVCVNEDVSNLCASIYHLNKILHSGTSEVNSKNNKESTGHSQQSDEPTENHYGTRKSGSTEVAGNVPVDLKSGNDKKDPHPSGNVAVRPGPTPLQSVQDSSSFVNDQNSVESEKRAHKIQKQDNISTTDAGTVAPQESSSTLMMHTVTKVSEVEHSSNIENQNLDKSTQSIIPRPLESKNLGKSDILDQEEAADGMTSANEGAHEQDADDNTGAGSRGESVDYEVTGNEETGVEQNTAFINKVPEDIGNGAYAPDKFVEAEDSHFFAYFMTMIVLCIIGYLVFHNKQKILALAVEGRSKRGTRRRPNTAGYRKLDSNLEEAVTSACSTSVTHVIY